MPAFRHDDAVAPDPRLERILRRLVLTGVALVLALPITRGYSAWIGALPLWLLGMPLVSWWALHRFRLPSWPMRTVGVVRRHPRMAQARRRRPARGRRIAHAA